MTQYSNDAEEVKRKASEHFSDCEVMELRFFIKKGKIVWVDPIERKELLNSKAKGEYTVQIVQDLKDQDVRWASPIAFQQDSPACSFWWIYVDAHGNIEKICLA